MSRLPRVCRRTREALPLFLSDDLSAGADRSAREHLAGCQGCRRQLRSWLDLRDQWRTATGPRRAPAGEASPDAAFFATLERQILDRVAAGSVATAPRRSRFRATALAAAVLLAATLTVVLAVRSSVPAENGGRLGGLLTASPILDSRPFVFDPDGPTRPVGETFTGLRGRQVVERAVEGRLQDAISHLTEPAERGR